MRYIVKKIDGFTSIEPSVDGEFEDVETARNSLKEVSVRNKDLIKRLIEQFSDKAGANGNKTLQSYLNDLLDKEDKNGVTIEDINKLPLPFDKKNFVKRLNELFILALKELVKVK